MAMPASGSISLNQANVEIGNSGTATISMNDADVRTLFDDASGEISMSQGHGKAWYTFHGWSANHGYAAGGHSPDTNRIDRWSFASGTQNAATVGSLTTAMRYGAATQDLTHGRHCGGWSGGYRSDIQKYAFASSGNASSVANCTGNNQNAFYSSSQTHGYIAGGDRGSYSNQIDKHQFSNDGNAVDTGANLTISGDWGGGCISQYYGWSLGGNNGLSHIAKYPFASATNATGTGSLSQSRKGVGGLNSETYGYGTGGYSSSNRIDNWSFASGGNATTVGALTVSRGYFADCSSTTHGHNGGGNTSISTIDKVSFSSGGNATAVGSLTIARGLMHGTQG